MINPNKFIGLKQQESMGPLTDPLQAEQDFLAKRMSQPVAVPGNKNQAISPVMQTDYPHADPNKGRSYIVNKEKTGTSKDTLFLPKDSYVSKSGFVDDEDIRTATKEAVAKGIYNLPKNNDMYNFGHLEESGKAKYKN
mgnify:CR=1 FL=1